MKQPLVSLCIPFYNQEKIVKDAVEGALSQTYENLEIVLSDDCSKDGTYEKIKELTKNYNGPHKIIINRNKTNLGLVPHVNKILFELCSGEYIFINGGDDIPLRNRVSDGIEYFLNDSSISALTSALIYIDGEGNESRRMNLKNDKRYTINNKEYISSKSFMCGNGMLAIKREVLETFGPLNDNCQTEDSCLRFRALLVGDLIASTKYGVKYRIHGNNISIGSVIYKLKTHPISEQYRRDLLIVKDKIPPLLYALLKKKIEYYEINRKTEAVCALSKSTIKKFLFRILRKIVAKRFQKAVTFYFNNDNK